MTAPPQAADAARLGAVDVQYLDDGGARAALVVSALPTFAALTEERTVLVEHVAEYRPGRFYERELPALVQVLSGTDPLDLLIVDGYVDLDPEGRPGLGAHVAAAGLAPVVLGVAKTRFRAATHATEVLRGRSARPLYVTATGMAPADAAELVRSMAGAGRLPDALRRVDRLARGAAPA
ncbi:endonuclease V [Promicromonospora thailandica]|uniref:Endonuclease V n=1 Tax=Promicromonospora thailandica TaxID=765201 RepID=A0A9X2JTN7_9MICO|nr:endonuclease V [Promicromonospora thailandica]MCP2263161.1 Endonuclease V [Promicromonospora thailandica]